jgi:hypothetical protein
MTHQPQLIRHCCDVYGRFAVYGRFPPTGAKRDDAALQISGGTLSTGTAA